MSEYYPGKGCKCGAYGEHECLCKVDWRSEREVELERELADARQKLNEHAFTKDIAKGMAEENKRLRAVLEKDKTLFEEMVRLGGKYSYINGTSLVAESYNRLHFADKALAKGGE